MLIESEQAKSVDQMTEELSIEDVDKILQGLENSLDSRVQESEVSIYEITKKDEKVVGSDQSLLRFECPTEVWEQFVEYCNRNELDPSQQIKEAVITYYKNLWETYKIRRKLFDDSKLI